MPDDDELRVSDSRSILRLCPTGRAVAFTIAVSYVAGGLVLLAPYFFFDSMRVALVSSVVVTLLALLAFGYVKGRFTTPRSFRSAWQTVIIGGLAATASFIITKAIG